MSNKSLTQLSFEYIEEYYNREFEKTIYSHGYGRIRINEYCLVTCDFNKVYPFNICYCHGHRIQVIEFKGVKDVITYFKNELKELVG